MAAVEVVGFPVSRLHSTGGGKGLVEGLGQFANVRLGPCQFGADAFHLGLDPLLLRLQQIDWQGVGVEGFEELLALGVERGETGAVAFDFPLVQIAHPGQRLVERGLHVCQVERPLVCARPFAQLLDLDLGVGGRDLLLDLVGWQVRQAAAGALDPAEAGEVVVEATRLAPALDEREVFPAGAAETALQEVSVLAVALAGQRVRVEDALDPVEGVPVDEGVVAPLVYDPAVADDAAVVVGSQDAGQMGTREWLGGPFASRPTTEATLLECRLHRVQGVGAAGEGGECPGDVRAALGIDGHGADLAAIHRLPDVEVADPGRTGGAAKLGLAMQSLLDLGGEVERVVLRDGGEDAVGQAARGRPVDALGGRHQLRAGLHDLEQHVGVVAAIARETINFVDDDVGGRFARPQPGQQFLERRAVRVRGCLGRVDELLGDLGLKLSGLTVAVRALRLKGVPLLGESAADLALA